MTRFDGQVAIVTGGATGIGLGIASRLGSDGSRVLIVDVDGELGEQSVAVLASRGIESRLVVGDVAESDVAERSVAEALDAWSRIDIMVNNAGLGGKTANIWELEVEEMDRIYRTNLRGVFLFCQKVLPHMMERDYGRIVNVASVAGKEGNPRMVPYSATKAAVIALTKSVAKEVVKTGIRVNCITPALVQTRILEQFTPEQVEYLVDRIPMGRMGEIEEIASLVAWLSSSECSFSTGAAFDISGGRSTY